MTNASCSADMMFHNHLDRTECALLMLSRKWGADYKAVRDKYQPDIAQVGAADPCRQQQKGGPASPALLDLGQLSYSSCCHLMWHTWLSPGFIQVDVDKQRLAATRME